MNNYQLKSHEYTCKSCTMNYAMQANNEEEAAFNVYIRHLDPHLLELEEVYWDARTKTLHTGLREYIVVVDSNEAVDGTIPFSDTEALLSPEEVVAEFQGDVEEVEKEYEEVKRDFFNESLGTWGD